MSKGKLDEGFVARVLDVKKSHRFFSNTSAPNRATYEHLHTILLFMGAKPMRSQKGGLKHTTVKGATQENLVLLLPYKHRSYHIRVSRIRTFIQAMENDNE